MTDYPASVQELIAALRELPSVGPRSAERLALFLMQSPARLGERLADAIHLVRKSIRPCRQCGFFAEQDLCQLCLDEKRDRKLWCVVEHPGDVLKLEKSGTFRGLYHVLGGRLSPLDGIGPEELSIAPILKRVQESPPEEVILALSADVEGETTALYLAPLLKKAGLKVTRLATGLPAGGGLEYADSVTLGYALSGRKEI